MKTRKKDGRKNGEKYSIIPILASVFMLGLGIYFIIIDINFDIQMSPGENAAGWDLRLGIALIAVGLVTGYFWLKNLLK